jgi:hypothetical protein
MRDFAQIVGNFAQHRNENRLAFALPHKARESKELFMTRATP